MRISELVDVNSIEPHLKARKKEQLLHELLALLKRVGGIKDDKQVEAELLEREALGPTGIGGGIAIPHLLTSQVEHTVMAMGIKREGVKYDSVDGAPVRLVFLILGPQGQESQHLKLLCELSRLLRNEHFKDRLLAAKTKKEIKQLLDSFEDQQGNGRYSQVANR